MRVINTTPRAVLPTPCLACRSNFVLQRTAGTWFASTNRCGRPPLNTALGAMSLVRVASPETETEIVLISARLEAAGIPHFVHNAGIGGLYPGLQIGAYNTRSIMVPLSAAEEASRLIAELELGAPPPAVTQGGWQKLRVIVEALLLGWFIPGSRRARPSPDRT